MRKLLPDRYTLLAGFLVVAAFPPWDLDFLIWFALVPWFVALARAPTHRAAIREGMWLSFLMTIGGFQWIARVLHEFGNLPWAVAILMLLVYAFFGQLQLSTFAPLFRLTCGVASGERREGKRINEALAWVALASAVYVGVDWLLPKLFADTLGHAFYRARVIRQVAEIGSVWGLTYLVLFSNLSLWVLVHRVRTRREPSARPAIAGAVPTLIAACVLVVACVLFGRYRLDEVDQRLAKPQDSLKIALIQANIGDFDKVAAEQGVGGAARKIINTYFDMSDGALALTPKPEAIVWPETSYPSTFRHPQTSNELARDQSVESFVRERKVPLLFGGYDTDGKFDYNAFFFLSPTAVPGATGPASDLQTYRKQVLLLFGEYIPGADQISFIKKAFPQVANFGRGPGPTVLMIPREGKAAVPVNPLICYEVLFPSLVAEGARKGGRAILNITNDSWFGDWAEPQLHLALATFRTIEARIPLIRSTNTGISTLVLPDGDITHPTGVSQAAVLNLDVPLIEPMDTLVKRWGDWFGPTMFIVGVIGGFAWYWRRRTQAA